jgi:hypothetical protein
MLDALISKTQDIVTILGVPAALISFVIGLRRYTAAKRWQVLEYVAKEMDRFYSIPDVRKALSMLDYNSRAVLLFPDSERSSDRYTVVTDAVLFGALDTDPSRTFDAVETAIRDIFDVLFNELLRLHAHIRTGLFRFNDFHPYIAYWLDIMRDGRSRKDAAFVKRLREFLRFYSYDGVLELINESAKPRA